MTIDLRPTTSADFRKGNAILFSVPLRNPEAKTPEDYIDMNRNTMGNSTGATRFDSTGKFIWSIHRGVDLEPVLKVSMQQLRAFAARRDLEVVTSADFGSDIMNGKDRISLQDLLPDQGPLHKDALWAVDLKTNELLVYAPTACQPRGGGGQRPDFFPAPPQHHWGWNRYSSGGVRNWG